LISDLAIILTYVGVNYPQYVGLFLFELSYW